LTKNGQWCKLFIDGELGKNKESNMKKLVISFMVLMPLVLVGVFQYAGSAVNSPDVLMNEAVSDINVAIKLAKQAQNILSKGMTKENIQTAIELYIQAGQLFEKSENVFRALGPGYASQEDIDNCAISKKECVDALKKLKEALQHQ
jgi:hypothetical protein